MRKMTFDRVTIVAGLVMWIGGLCAGLLFGEGMFESVVGSMALSLLFCLSYVLFSDPLKQFVSTPLRALIFFICGIFLVFASLGTDCVVGSMHSSGLPLGQACLSKSGIGIVFSAAMAICVVGVPLVGLLRAIVQLIWRR